MPIFHDIALEKTIMTGRTKRPFADFIDHELGYSWDGSGEGKIGLIQYYMMEQEKKIDPEPSNHNLESNIYDLESRLLPVLAEMENT